MPDSAIVPIPFHMMEAARRLVRHGRYWLDLTDEDIERGARAVALSPAYRAELARTAIVHANDRGDAVDAAICAEAWDELDRWAALRARAVPATGGLMSAHHRFNNDLRYRDGSHPQQTQLTPSYVLDPVRVALGGTIELDPCTLPDNPVGAERFYTVDEDGLAQPWDAQTIFVNPPYGKAREPWAKRCMEAGQAGASVVLLMPAATDTRIFQKALATADEAVLVQGRLKFGVLRPNRRQQAASHPSALLGWNVDLSPCSHLGLLVTPHEGAA